MKTHILALAAIAALAATPALAATVIQTPAQTETMSAGQNTYAFTQFDSSLGTLDSVTLTFDFEPTASGSIKNGSNTTKSYTVTESVTASLKGDGLDLSDTFNSSRAFTNMSGKQSINFASLSSTADPVSETLSSDLSAFTGKTGVQLILSLSNPSYAITSGDNSGKLTITPNSFGFGGHVSLAYNYTPAPEINNPGVTPGVPEPATWAMLILGVAMIGFAARRRNATLALAA